MMTDCAKKLDENHGSKGLLTVTRGKLHRHLGMTLEFDAIRNACVVA